MKYFSILQNEAAACFLRAVRNKLTVFLYFDHDRFKICKDREKTGI